MESYKPGDKAIPWEQVSNPFAGSRLEGISYRQLIPWVNPGEGAFRVVTGDFVTTEEGTGIVHIAPTFGDDDNKVAKKYNIPALLMRDTNGNLCPMVDKTGKFYRLEDRIPPLSAGWTPIPRAFCRTLRKKTCMIRNGTLKELPIRRILWMWTSACG